MLSRKYYIEFAKILNNRFKASPTSEELRYITRELISFFKSDNLNFDESRFLIAINK